MTTMLSTTTEQTPLPVGWRWARLGDVCEFLDSRRIPINDAERAKRIAGKKQSELFPYYGANGQVGWIDDYIFDEPLILLAEDGGYFGSEDKPIAYAVSGRYWVNNHAHVLKPRPDVIDFDYCLHALRIRPDVGDLVSGSTRAKLNQEIAATIPVILPPLYEQRRIATRLNEIMAEITRARAAAQAGLDAANALPAALLRAVFESDEAKGWEKKRLVNVCRDIADGTHVTPEYLPSGVPFLSVKDIKETGISFDDCRFISKEQHEFFIRRCKPERGDVLYTKVGTTGIAKAIDVDREFSIFVSVALLKLRPEVLPGYLERVLNAPISRRQAEELTQGMANRNLVLQDLKRIEIPLPSLSKQQRIATQLEMQMENARQAIAAVQAQLAAINALPAVYLQRAFRGEL